MPSSLPLPTVSDLRKAGASAITGLSDRFADTRDGSYIDHIAGPLAILFARESDVDQGLFRAIYIDDADGDDLTNLIQGRWGIPRIVDTYGIGTCQLMRANATAGAGTIWAGTRIALAGTTPMEYVVAANTAAAASSATVTVPIRANTIGTGTACSTQVGLSIKDPLYDPLWVPALLVCADGTNYESADAYRARARALRRENRNGYLEAINDACAAVGATYVVPFASSYGLAARDFADDYGINAIYVADKNSTSSAALILACTIALEQVRVLGAELYVGGIATTLLPIAATVTLTDDPGRLGLVPIQRALVQAIVSYFSASGAGYVYKRAGLAGAMAGAHPAVQTVTFTTPTSDPQLPNTTLPVVQAWPATLIRYIVSPNQINLTFSGPV